MLRLSSCILNDIVIWSNLRAYIVLLIGEGGSLGRLTVGLRREPGALTHSKNEEFALPKSIESPISRSMNHAVLSPDRQSIRFHPLCPSESPGAARVGAPGGGLCTSHKAGHFERRDFRALRSRAVSYGMRPFERPVTRPLCEGISVGKYRALIPMKPLISAIVTSNSPIQTTDRCTVHGTKLSCCRR